MADIDTSRPAVSIIVPVYRSAEILPTLVERIAATFRGPGGVDEFEVVLVCDASPDRSWEVIESLATAHPFVRGICLRKNAGQHNATMAGLHYAAGSAIVIIDDDLQHPPEAIPRMLAELDRGFDVCYTRYVNRKHPLWKRLGSAVNDACANLLLDKPRGLYLSSFKAMRREIAVEVIKYDGPYPYVDGLILDVTRSISSIDIEHQARAMGKGNYNLRRSISLWLKLATSFSVIPLRIMSIIGASIGVLSLGMIIYLVIGKLRDPTIQAGWTSLVATVLFVGGIQLVGMGLLGEYLGRAYLKLNHKPQFVVQTITGPGDVD
jgi:undecaprenyl-phosphate 4-deoxy-4-formamido-L-arabinose transferase